MMVMCSYVCVRAKLLQFCQTLCDPMDCSPPGSSVHGILQARIWGWASMPSSRESVWSRDRTHISHLSCTGRQVLYCQCPLESLHVPIMRWILTTLVSWQIRSIIGGFPGGLVGKEPTSKAGDTGDMHNWAIEQQQSFEYVNIYSVYNCKTAEAKPKTIFLDGNTKDGIDLTDCYHYSGLVVVQSLSHVWLFMTSWIAAYQAYLSFTISQSFSGSHPLSQWWYLTILSSATLFFFCLQSFPASESFPMSGSLDQVAKVLELQHQSFQWIFRVDFL